jgi:hypothetical protein
MDVSLDEHELGGLRWIVVRGPDRAAFRALGEHMRAETAALIQTWGLVDKLRRYVSDSPGRARLASVRQASERDFPAAWAELAAFAEGSGLPFDDLALMNFRGDLGQVIGGFGCSDRPRPGLVPQHPGRHAAARRGPSRPPGRGSGRHAVHDRRRPHRGRGRPGRPGRAAGHDPAARPGRRPPGPQLAGFSQTETCWLLSLVNGSRAQPLHRSRSRSPASRAIRSSSAGHAYRNGMVRYSPQPSAKST